MWQNTRLNSSSILELSTLQQQQPLLGSPQPHAYRSSNQVFGHTGQELEAKIIKCHCSGGILSGRFVLGGRSQQCTCLTRWPLLRGLL